MIAARQIFLGTSQGNKEEEMYKELFIGLAENTLPEVIVIPAEITRINRQFWLYNSTVQDVTFLGNMYPRWGNNSVAYGSPNLRILRLPNTTEIGYFSPLNNGRITELYIPKLQRFYDPSWVLGTKEARLDVYISESTCAQIKAMHNFPAVDQGQEGKIVFHGSDGTIAYDGSDWVITQNANGGGGMNA